jgi:CHASE3 domain sensor protein
MATRRNFQTTATLGFAILAILLACGMAFSIRRLESVADTQVGRLRVEENEITLVERLRWSSELVVSSGRGYLIAGEPELLAQVHDAKICFNQTA